MKVIVYVTPKKSVLDPQGAAVGRAMGSLGFPTSKEVRVGKSIEFELEMRDSPQFRKELDRICQDLLSNPVIEDYRYEVLTL